MYRDENQEGLFSKLFGIILICAIGYLFFHGYQTKKSSVSWPDCEGLVLESHVVEVRETDNHTQFSSTYFTLKVRYRYEVAQQMYHGNRIKVFEPRYGSEAQAKQMLERFEEGDTVKVYYDPLQPSSSVLIPG